MSTTYYLLGSQSASPSPVPIVRDPLPEFDKDTTDPDTGAALPVYTVLREDTFPSDMFWRGDAWGLTIEGLPYVAGGNTGSAQSRVLTYFLDRYGLEREKEILRLHQEYGYTYISLSPQDSFAFGTSEDDYVRMSVRCRKAGLNVHHLMRSKYYTSAVSAFSQKHVKPNLRIQNRLLEKVRTPSIQPVSSIDLSEHDQLIERLLREGVMQVETPAWEMNYWSPSICRQMIDHDAALIGTRAHIMLHFYPHYISWQENNETPTDFWQQNYGKVDGILYQCDPYWTAGMMAARIQDGLDRLCPHGMWGLKDSGREYNGELHDIWYVVWETIATCQFNNMKDGDGRLADEDIGNLKGYECTCSPGAMTVKGYGNGGRMPDGSPL